MTLGARVDADATVVVMPLYNERGLVGRCIRRIPAWVHAIVVVNDGSTDGSRDEVEQVGDRRVVVLDTPRRSGPGRALQVGLRWALERGAAYVVTMDADGQMAPADLPAVLAPLRSGSSDYVKGNRFDASVCRAAMPWTRRLANRLLSALASRVLDDPDLTDAHCGYTAVTGPLLDRVDLHGLHAGYGVYVDILARVKAVAGARVTYVPVQALYGAERSHFRWWRALPGYLRMIARVYRSHRAGRSTRRTSLSARARVPASEARTE